jgi:hypothetical protein
VTNLPTVALILLMSGGALSAADEAKLSDGRIIRGHSQEDVILANDTGLPIARIEINSMHYEGSGGANVSDKILISVTPVKHNLRLIFRGGANVDWPKFDFRGVHEIIFERSGNQINAHVL